MAILALEDEPKEAPRQRWQARTSGNIKMNILPFRETSSPEEYLEWGQRVEKVFECQEYTEAKKVKLATLECTDYANLWWKNLKAKRRHEGENPVKRLMEKRFVP